MSPGVVSATMNWLAGAFLPALRRFSAVSDLWTAEAMRGGLIRPGQYEQALGALGIERRFSEVVESHWAQAAFALLAGKAVVPFNWELAFPHVFLAHTQRGQTGSGFDVVLGNPPYDVLSEKESGQNIDHIKRFIEIDPQLTPARVGKNNLYKLFIARSVNLLAEGGYFSFIVPMPLVCSVTSRPAASAACCFRAGSSPRFTPSRRRTTWPGGSFPTPNSRPPYLSIASSPRSDAPAAGLPLTFTQAALLKRAPLRSTPTV